MLTKSLASWLQLSTASLAKPRSLKKRIFFMKGRMEFCNKILGKPTEWGKKTRRASIIKIFSSMNVFQPCTGGWWHRNGPSTIGKSASLPKELFSRGWQRRSVWKLSNLPYHSCGSCGSNTDLFAMQAICHCPPREAIFVGQFESLLCKFNMQETSEQT